jgi:hypothetical protein
MSTIQIFDPALCCSSGVCGPDVDQTLVTAAADIEWARKLGIVIERYNLAQQPLVFAGNPVVRDFLEHSGADALPLVLVDGRAVLAGRYPTRAELSEWTGVVAPPADRPASCCGGCC